MTKKTMTTTTRVLLFKMAASSCQLSIVSLSFVVLFVQISTCQVSSDTKRSDVKVDAYVKELNESEFQQFINRSSVGIVYFQRKGKPAASMLSFSPLVDNGRFDFEKLFLRLCFLLTDLPHHSSLTKAKDFFNDIKAK